MTEIKLRGNSSSILLSIGWILLAAGCQGSPAPTQTPRMPASTLKPGDVRTDAKGIEQVWVEAGTFRMGTDEESLRELENLNPPGFVAGEFAIEQPQHEVRITQGYWIDKFEVTNRAFRAFADGGGYAARAYWSDEGWAWREDQPAGMLPLYCMGTGPDHPAACATWYEAEAYARWRGGRLPTEAEWEYAARGPESRVFPWGDAFDPDLCNVTGGSSTKPAGSYPGGASWVGAQDMAGNVMEWVQDWLGPYAAEAASDPAGPAQGRVKVEKGGWWGATFFVARAAYRHFEDPPDYQDAHIGFRIVTTE